MRRTLCLSLGLSLVVATTAQGPKAENMNGDYPLSATPGADKSGSKFPKRFSDYPGDVEFFDVYSPMIRSTYGEVFWTLLDPVPLPQAIVAKYAGKGMAVVGFETNQVRRTATGEEVSVPINVAYNHHFESTMTGNKSVLEKVKLGGPDDPRRHGHGHGSTTADYAWVVRELAPGIKVGGKTLPTSQDFGGANGGEYRKSFHGCGASMTTHSVESKTVPAGCALTLTPSAATGAASGAATGAATGAVSCAATWNSAPPESPTSPCGGKAKDHAGKRRAAGVVSALSGWHLEVSLSEPNQTATLTITGPADEWFGVGFNATTMGGGAPGDPTGPYAILVGGGDGEVSERRLYNHAAGELLEPSIKVLSSAVLDGKRTLVLERPLNGTTPQHFSFRLEDDAQGDASLLSIISAIGSGPTFGLDHHSQKTTTTLALLQLEAPMCICPAPEPAFGFAKGTLEYIDPVTNSSKGKVGFDNTCAPPPRMDTLAEKNPACDLRTYAGGQIACHHEWVLLDADQPTPWADQPLEYQLKFRYWVQPYDPSFHTNVYRNTWGLGSPVEYDVAQCAPGTPTAQCNHTITGLGIFQPKPSATSPHQRLVKANFHCHAPTCLAISLYTCDPAVHTSCQNKTLLCEERPIYGGRGDPRLAGTVYDEPGYIAQPPCVWGRSEHGLEPPPLISGVNLYAEATTNNTYGHHGEMAWLQVYYLEED